ncbi:MAG: hypothetical protein D6820_17425, partial [Lentisphaerae bacterium]
LKAVAYDDDGNPCRETVVRTAGPPARIRLVPEESSLQLRADGEAMAFVMAEICDANGILCPTADTRIQFHVEGPLTILAADNGDQTSLDPFRKDWCRAFNGRCMLYLGTIAGEAGTARITATAPGLEPAVIEIAIDP